MKFFPQGITVGDAKSLVEKDFRIKKYKYPKYIKHELQNKRNTFALMQSKSDQVRNQKNHLQM